MTTVPFDEIIPGGSARLCVIDGEQFLSIRDVIMYFGGKEQKTANKTWERFDPEDKEEVATFCRHFKFPGQGKKSEPVINFQGAIKLVMKISGENAKKYRTAIVKILTRYYAGDGSLTDEIEKNARSDLPIAQMARAALETEQPVQEVSLEFKRKREELEMCRIEAEIESMKTDIDAKRKANRAADLANHAAETEHLAKITTNYRALCEDTVMDERARLIFKDSFLNMVMLQAPAAITNGEPLGDSNKPTSLSLVASEMGLKIPTGDLISIGGKLKKTYEEKHGKPPSKHDQLCNGRMTKVNSYTEADRPLIEAALNEWRARVVAQ